MSGEELILRFYEFNGQAVSIEQLKNFHEKVQAYVDSIGHGPYVPTLNAINGRVVYAIKDWKKKEITEVEKMIIEPVKVEEQKPTTPKASPAVSSKEIRDILKQELVKFNGTALKKVFKHKSRGRLGKPDSVIKDYIKGSENLPLQKQLDLYNKQLKHFASMLRKKVPKKWSKELQKEFVETYERTVIARNGLIDRKQKILKKQSLNGQKVSKQKVSKKKRGLVLSGVGENKSPKQNMIDQPVPPQPVQAPSEPKPVKNSGVSYDYKPVELGKYQNDFHRMYSDTIVQIHGMPGHGKTVWLLKYAQYLAEQGGHVLYVAREEFGRSVFDMKLKENNIGHDNLRFRRELEPEDMEWATAIFLDSVSALKLNHEDIERLSIEYPNRNWYVVLQATKDGDFRGSNEWEHLVDIAGEVRNRTMILNKNRLDKDNADKREKLQTQSAIEDAKKKIEIKEAVKKSLIKEVPINQQAA